MKIVNVVGARPQFIKAAAISRAFLHAASENQNLAMEEVLIHTGQHYDDGLSAVFFRDLGIPKPRYFLEVGSAGHGRQTGTMMTRLEPVLESEDPNFVVIYGDTNTTLAAALVAAKLRLPLAHVEAGLRSRVREMPEEINRIVADHLSNLLFCPSERAAENLRGEGITEGVHVVGDVMQDILLEQVRAIQGRPPLSNGFGAAPSEYALVTIHRAETTDNVENLRRVCEALGRLAEQDIKILFPLHPRTRKALKQAGIALNDVCVLDPVSYPDALNLQMHARVILTDSGGIQKEAYWLGVPCITLRDETEWGETVETGWNTLAGLDPDLIVRSALEFKLPTSRPRLYGDGAAAVKIVKRILHHAGADEFRPRQDA